MLEAESVLQTDATVKGIVVSYISSNGLQQINNSGNGLQITNVNAELWSIKNGYTHRDIKGNMVGDNGSLRKQNIHANDSATQEIQVAE